MKKIIFFFLLLGFSGTLFTSCQKNGTDVGYQAPELDLPATEFNYSGENFPDHFDGIASFDNEPNNNKRTDAGATLGRVLFYDTKLSLNNTVSCGTCHIQSKAFSDGKKFSPGFEGNLSTRNTLAIVNPRFAATLTWTGQNITLEEQVLQPIGNHLEMGLENLDHLATKISKVDYYPALFEKAFGSTEVTHEKISRALSQFLRSMECSQSKFDQGYNNDWANFTALEKMGKDLFESAQNGCDNCHRNVNFYYGSEANIGLSMDYADEGAGNGRFRIPSLRNIALTGPYMHNGQFETLEEVIDHYNDGVQPHPNLDWRLTSGNGEPKKLDLSETEKQALVAYLKTLTDEQFITNIKWSNPFK